MRQSFTIHKWHPTPLNKLLNSHWAKAAKMKKEDATLIFAYQHKDAIAKAKSPRRVELHIQLDPGQRACDPDAYWKSLLDGLKKCGLIVDDNRQWCEAISPPTFSRGPIRATTITLTDLPED